MRIEMLDVMRGIAVCGILAVNIFVMGAAGETQGRTFPARLDADWIAWLLERLFLEGPMRGLFTILFGAGMLMMLRRSEGEAPEVVPIDVWARRCLTLLALGVAHFLFLMWPGEILWTYGLAGLALLAFRTAGVRTLWACGLLIILCLSAHRAYDTSKYVATYQIAAAAEADSAAGMPQTKEQQEAVAAAAAARSSNYPSNEAIAEEVAQRTSLRPLFLWSASGWASRHLGVYSWIGVAESLAFMLIGMALYRARILTGEASRPVYWRMTLIAGSVGIAVRVADLGWQARTGFELDIHRINPLMSLLRSLLYQPARLALTLSYVGLFGLALSRGARLWTKPFGALGRTALTVYTLQSALTSLLFYGLGYFGAFGAAELMLVTLGICVVTALFSSLWLRWFDVGPFEWLLRAIAYNTFSPIRRPAADDVLARSEPL
jgi:uncharacterized protein